MYKFILRFLFISLITAILTVYDKIAAKRGARRIRERTLLLCGFFGGALCEYAVMLLIRHKTRKKKFMITLPLFIILHAALLVVLIYYGVITW